MGMFKDIKKLKDQGKEIGQKSGRPTSMMGMIKDMPNQIHQATEMVDDAMALQADMQKQQQLLATGTAGTATIKGVTDTGVLINYNPQVVLDLAVECDGKTFDSQLSTAIPQVQLAMLQIGNKVGVKVDPADQSSIAIDWTRPQG